MELSKTQRKWIAQLSEWRLVIGNYIQLMDKLQERSAETTLAKRSLQLSRSWLGRMKKDIDNTSMVIYTPTFSAGDIPPLSDTAKCPDLPFQEHLMNINEFLNAFTRISHALRTLMIEISLEADTNALEEFILPMRYSLMHLEESSTWLKYELQRIREQHILNNPVNQ